MTFLCPLSSPHSLLPVLSLLFSLPSPLSSATYYVKEPFEGRFKSTKEKKNCPLDGIDLTDKKYNLIRTCNDDDLGNIFCYGKILEAIQYHWTHTLWKSDSKHIVDRPLINSAKDTVDTFKKEFGVKEWKDFKVTTMNVTTLEDFVRDNFGQADNVLDEYTPEDFKENPPKLENIADSTFKNFSIQLNNLWKQLGRKMPEKHKNSGKTTLIYVERPFVVPGGRFREFYYWDAYWIVRGLLASGMTQSVKDMCLNYLAMVEKFGFVPNGGRIYYNKRSQPPFLTFMVYDYFAETGDTEFLKKYLPTLEKELDFWKTKRAVEIELNGEKTTFYQYRAESNVPRPESFCEDVHMVNGIQDMQEKARIWREIASAAESGWDFSTRWIEEDPGSSERWKLSRLMITNIVPVDLNALICGNMEMLSTLYHQIGDKEKANRYHKEFQEFREKVHALFYEDGGWFDYNIKKGERIKRYYGSIVVPLFARCYHTANVEETEKMFATLEKFNNENGILNLQYGVPTSAETESEEQWDYPNIWPPLTHMLIESLRRSGSKRMEEKAKGLAEQWVSANYKLYNLCGKHMWEKMTATNGTAGEGGEYTVQIGFGWSNGAVLDLLVTYGKEIKLKDDFPKVNCTKKEFVREPEKFPLLRGKSPKKRT